MSEENVELVRSLYRAPDPRRFFALLDEEIEFDFSTHPLLDYRVHAHCNEAARSG